MRRFKKKGFRKVRRKGFRKSYKKRVKNYIMTSRGGIRR